MKVLMTIPAAQDEPFDATVAEQEGWGVFDCGRAANGTRERQLQRIDCPEDGEPPFADDQAALQSASRPVPPGDRLRRWAHVAARARAGSELHRTALAAVDPVERALIEASCGAW